MQYQRVMPAIGLWGIVSGVTVAALCMGRSTDGIGVGEVLILCGAMVLLCSLVCYEIRKTNRPADVAYKEGYEMGHDKGWRDGFTAAQPDATVHSIERRDDALDRKATERALPGRLA